MITYGFSVQGKSHIKRGIICQDYNKTVKLAEGWHLGVVADGVGSAIHSDIGSRVATEALCEYCEKRMDAGMSHERLESMLREGYQYALEQVLDYAQGKNDIPDAYDTTLSAALYDGKKVVFGHAGDGGILVRLCDGRIKPITKRQKGADGSSVRPLRAGVSSWDFGVFEEKTAAVLLVTDGMLDGVFQPVLVNLPPNKMALARGDFSQDNAYITAAEFFMNPSSIYRNKKISRPDEFLKRFILGDLEEKDQDSFQKSILESYTKMFGKNNAGELGKRISQYYYAVWALKNITDDKTVVCMMNENAKVTPQELSYYFEPDWQRLQECYHALLYDKPMPTELETSTAVKKSNKQKRMIIIRSAVVLFCFVLVGSVMFIWFGGKEPEENVHVTEKSKKLVPSPSPKRKNERETSMPQGTGKPKNNGKEQASSEPNETRKQIDKIAEEFVDNIVEIRIPKFEEIELFQKRIGDSNLRRKLENFLKKISKKSGKMKTTSPSAVSSVPEKSGLAIDGLISVVDRMNEKKRNAKKPEIWEERFMQKVQKYFEGLALAKQETFKGHLNDLLNMTEEKFGERNAGGEHKQK